MPSPSSRSGGPERELIKAMRKLTETLEHLPQEHSFMFHPGKHVVMTYLKGITHGLGLITAVAIVVPLIVAMMRHVQWVPLVGDFVNDVATRVEESNQR